MHWRILNQDYIHKCRWINLRKDEVELPNGVVIPDFYVVEYPDWINVIAVTEDGRLVMEKQYRHGL